MTPKQFFEFEEEEVGMPKVLAPLFYKEDEIGELELEEYGSYEQYLETNFRDSEGFSGDSFQIVVANLFPRRMYVSFKDREKLLSWLKLTKELLSLGE